MNNCPKCGFPVTLDETECSNCGEPVENKDNLDVSPENEEKVIDTPETIDSDVVDDEPEITTIGLDDESEIEDISEIIPVAELNSVEEPIEAEVLIDESEDEEDTSEELEPIAVTPDELPEVEPLEEDLTPETIKGIEEPVIEQPEVLEVEVPEPIEMPVLEETASETVLQPEPIAPPETLDIPLTEPAILETPIVEEISENVPVSEPLPIQTPIPMVPEAPTVAEDIPVMPVSDMPAVGLDPSLVGQPVLEGMPVAPEVMDPNLANMSPVPNQTLDMQALDNSQPILDNREVPGGLTVPEMPLPVKEEDPSLKALKFRKVTFIIVILISLIVIALTAFFMSKIISNNNQADDTNISENAKEYHYEGFDLYIDDDYYAEIYESELYIGNENWSAIMTLQTGTYNTLVSNKSQLVDYFKEMGYETTEPAEKEISGTAFITMEVMMGSKNILVAYAKANGTKLFGIVLENESGDYTSDDCLKPIGNILSTMKYVGPTYSLPEGFRLDSFIETFNVAE